MLLSFTLLQKYKYHNEFKLSDNIITNLPIIKKAFQLKVVSRF